MEKKSPASVTLYSVPFNHRGSAGQLMKEALRNITWPDYSGLLYIAPTPRKIRHAQKTFHSLVKSPYIPPRFFTFNQLAKYFFDLELPGQHLPAALIPLIISEISGHSIAYASVLSELLSELRQYHPSKKFPQVRQELAEIFERFGIPEEALRRLDSAMDIFDRYRGLLDACNVFDDNDISALCRSAMNKSLQNFSVLVAEGFYDMTASEKNLLNELVSKTEKALFAVPYAPALSTSLADYLEKQFDVSREQIGEDAAPDLSFFKYNSLEEEIEGIARHIKNYYISGRFRADDFILVTAPQISSYEQLIDRVFRRYGLPYSFSSGKIAAQKTSLRDVLHLLESIADDYPRLKFTSVLCSPHLKNIPELLKERSPSLSLRSGILKSRASWEALITAEDNKTYRDSVKRAVSDVFNLLHSLDSIKNSAELDALNAAVRKLLTDLHFTAEQDEIDMLYKAMDNISMVFGLTGQTAISLKKYTDFLRHILNTKYYEEEVQGIQVMDFFETKGLEPDYLYFCGLKDGDLPAKPPIDHILPDTVRTEYGLINLGRYLQNQKLNFLRLAGSSVNRHLSYPGMDGDKVFLPSPYLPWGRELSRQIFGIFSVEEQQAGEGKTLLSESIHEIKLNSRTKERISGKNLAMPLRVTDIDYFRKCPRRFFITRLLDLEASEITDYELEAKTLGTLIHKIMEVLLKEPVADAKLFQERASSVLDAVLDRLVMESYWKDLIKESFMEVLPEIIETESALRSEDFQPHKLEMKVTGEVLPGISLKGKIDRVDCNGEIYRIIDYKTGTVTIGSNIIKKGLELQLPLYSAILKAYGMHVEKAGIYSLKDIGIKWIPTTRDKNSLDDYIKGALYFLDETVTAMKAGHFPALPLEEFYCTSCPDAPFCPFIHAKPGEEFKC